MADRPPGLERGSGPMVSLAPGRPHQADSPPPAEERGSAAASVTDSVPACAYCGSRTRLLEPCCGRHPDVLVCEDVAACARDLVELAAEQEDREARASWRMQQ